MDLLISSASNSGYPPCIRFFVFVIQWFETLIFLELAELSRVGKFEECGGEFDKPFWIYSCHFTHIFFCGLYQFMVNNPKNTEIKGDN